MIEQIRIGETPLLELFKGCKIGETPLLQARFFLLPLLLLLNLN